MMTLLWLVHDVAACKIDEEVVFLKKFSLYKYFFTGFTPLSGHQPNSLKKQRLLN